MRLKAALPEAPATHGLVETPIVWPPASEKLPVAELLPAGTFMLNVIVFPFSFRVRDRVRWLPAVPFTIPLPAAALSKQLLEVAKTTFEAVMGAWFSPVAPIADIPSVMVNVKDIWGGDILMLLVVAVQFPLRLLGCGFEEIPNDLCGPDPPAHPASRKAKSANRERTLRWTMGSLLNSRPGPGRLLLIRRKMLLISFHVAL